MIKFLLYRNKTNVEIENELFQVQGDAAHKKSMCKSGQKDFMKVEKACKTMIVLDRELIWSDQHLTVCKIAEECHISYGSVQNILIEKFGSQQKENYAKLHLPIFNVV